MIKHFIHRGTFKKQSWQSALTVQEKQETEEDSNREHVSSKVKLKQMLKWILTSKRNESDNKEKNHKRGRKREEIEIRNRN